MAMVPSYNLWLVLLSYLVAAFAAFTMLDLASRLNHPDGGFSRGRIAAGALAMGPGIWGMHFIGMIALHLPVQLSYDVTITLASILPAVGASAIALFIMRRPVVSRALHCQGALAMGIGIAAMHYTGMAAIRMSPDFAAGSVCITPPLGVDPIWLAVMVGVGSCLILFATLAVSMGDVRRLEDLRRIDADTLVRATALADSMSADAKASEAHTRAIVESSLDCIITIDGLGRIVEFNRAAQQTFGYARAEVMGRTLSQCIIPPDLREAHDRGLARAMAGGRRCWGGASRSRPCAAAARNSRSNWR